MSKRNFTVCWTFNTSLVVRCQDTLLYHPRVLGCQFFFFPSFHYSWMAFHRCFATATETKRSLYNYSLNDSFLLLLRHFNMRKSLLISGSEITVSSLFEKYNSRTKLQKFNGVFNHIRSKTYYHLGELFQYFIIVKAI